MLICDTIFNAHENRGNIFERQTIRRVRNVTCLRRNSFHYESKLGLSRRSHLHHYQVMQIHIHLYAARHDVVLAALRHAVIAVHRQNVDGGLTFAGDERCVAAAICYCHSYLRIRGHSNRENVRARRTTADKIMVENCHPLFQANHGCCFDGCTLHL